MSVPRSATLFSARGASARGTTLFSSLVYGALAALGSIPWLLAGHRFATYALAASVGYLLVIAPSWSLGVPMAALAAALAVTVGLFAPPPLAPVLGATLILSVIRSGFYFRAGPARVLLIEGLLCGGGLVFAGALYGRTVASLALATWAFFLVQSLYATLGGLRTRPSPEDDGVDPFERARRGALELIGS